MGNRASWTSLQQLLQNLSPHEQRSFLDAVLRDTVRQYLHNHSYPDEGSAALSDKARTIGAVAAMIDGIVHSNPVLEDHVMEWLTSATGEYASLGLDARRAVIATLALRAGVSLSFIDLNMLTISRQVAARSGQVLGELWQ